MSAVLETHNDEGHLAGYVRSLAALEEISVSEACWRIGVSASLLDVPAITEPLNPQTEGGCQMTEATADA